MTGIGFPINVVVVHGPNHVAVQKRRIDRVSLERRHERRGAAGTTTHRPIVLEQNFRVILLTPAKRAANGIKPK